MNHVVDGDAHHVGARRECRGENGEEKERASHSAILDAMQPQTNSMNRTRDLSVGCLVAFMLPFFAGGLVTAWTGIQGLQRGESGFQVIVPLIVGIVFIGFSTVLVVAAVTGFRRAAANAALRLQNPDKPWLWRKEWSDGVIVSHGAAQSASIAVFALFWNAIAIPSAFIAFTSTDVREQPAVLLVMIFPVIGMFLFIAAVYQLLRARKYGRSRVMLPHIPVSIGATCRGEIVTHVKERPENGFALKLQCLRRTVTGSGRNRSTQETELWRDDQRVSGLVAVPTVDGFRVPFSVEIPSDTKPTDERVVTDQIVWRLNVTAETPGIDYAAQFELPVFVTSETQHEVKRFVPSATEVTSWTPQPASHITILPDEIRIASHARARDILAMFFFNVIWFGTIVVLYRFGAPMFFPIIFALLGLLVLYAMIDAVIGRTSIRADSSGIVVRRTWFGAGMASTIGVPDIKAIVANPTPNSSSYEIDVIGSGDSKTQIARYIAERHDAEMLAARIERAVSLTAGTQAAARS
jgi:hypothetical protein